MFLIEQVGKLACFNVGKVFKEKQQLRLFYQAWSIMINILRWNDPWIMGLRMPKN